MWFTNVMKTLFLIALIIAIPVLVFKLTFGRLAKHVLRRRARRAYRS